MGKKNTAVLAIAWPEVTARSEDTIMKVLRRVNIVKNLNVQVGHAAMIIVDGSKLKYYDFGRYITPKHCGRVRSQASDPSLALKTKAKWDENNKITNLEEICTELDEKSAYTHGEGLLQMGIFYHPDIVEVEKSAEAQQKRGLIPYNTFNKKSTNCARFVQTCLLAGLENQTIFRRRLQWPITFSAPTPYFNVLAGTTNDNPFWEWKAGKGQWKTEHLVDAVLEIISNVFDSMRSKKVKKFSKDQNIGKLHQLEPKPADLPDSAVYLGGIGEAAWYDYQLISPNTIKCKRWFLDGQLDFEGRFESDEPIDSLVKSNGIEITHDSHFRWITLQSTENKKFRIHNTVS